MFFLINKSGEEFLIEDDYKKQKYNFSVMDHSEKLNGDLRNFSLKFGLSNNFQGAIDEFQINFSNPEPKLENVKLYTGIQGVNVFEVLMDEKHLKDIQRIRIYSGESPDNVEHFYNHITSQTETKEYIRIPKEYYATESGHNTGNLFYEFRPDDTIGYGESYTGVSGNLTL